MARKTQALAFLSTTLTQGSADAFVQVSMATALTGLTKTSYRLKTLEWEFGQAWSAASGADYQFNLSRKSYAAMPTSPMLEKSNIFAYRQGSIQLSAVGALLAPPRVGRYIWDDDDAPIIVEDPLYWQLDTASTSATNVVYVRAGYWVDSISEVDRLQLVANSLS